MIIGLTGTFAAGKGTLAEYLIKKGFQYHSLSDELRLLLREKGMTPTRDNLIKAGNGLRERNGRGFLAQLVIKRLQNAPSFTNAIIDSIRNTGEIEELKKLKNFHLIAVDAPLETRYERAKQRGSQRDPKTLIEFMAQERKEMNGKGAKQQLKECMQMAEEKITNDSTLENLYKKTDALLQKLK